MWTQINEKNNRKKDSKKTKLKRTRTVLSWQRKLTETCRGRETTEKVCRGINLETAEEKTVGAAAIMCHGRDLPRGRQNGRRGSARSRKNPSMRQGSTAVISRVFVARSRAGH
jgi:hypothetical protein